MGRNYPKDSGHVQLDTEKGNPIIYRRIQYSHDYD